MMHPTISQVVGKVCVHCKKKLTPLEIRESKEDTYFKEREYVCNTCFYDKYSTKALPVYH